MPDKQENYKPARDEKGRILPGNTGNPNGRPKGKSLKEFWKERFAAMDEEEKIEFAKKVSPELLWQMAEGRPAQNTDITSNGESIIPIYGNKSIQGYPSDEKNIPTQE